MSFTTGAVIAEVSDSPCVQNCQIIWLFFISRERRTGPLGTAAARHRALSPSSNLDPLVVFVIRSFGNPVWSGSLRRPQGWTWVVGNDRKLEAFHDNRVRLSHCRHHQPGNRSCIVDLTTDWIFPSISKRNKYRAQSSADEKNISQWARSVTKHENQIILQ